MRLTRLALIVSVILMGTTSLRAQIAHTESCDDCGGQSCQSCQQGCQCGTCGSGCGLLSGFTASLHHALGGILPGHIGSDARHKIYRAALLRNTFDKKCLLPLPYYPHILPLYRHNRCCRGGVSTDCPTCGPHGAMGEEVLEMHEVPDGMPFEPTPAVKLSPQTMPSAVVAPKEARERAWNGRSVSRTRKMQQHASRGGAKQAGRDRVAQQERSNVTSIPTLGSYFTAPVLRPRTEEKVKVRQVSAVRERSEPDPINPLR